MKKACCVLTFAIIAFGCSEADEADVEVAEETPICDAGFDAPATANTTKNP